MWFLRRFFDVVFDVVFEVIFEVVRRKEGRGSYGEMRVFEFWSVPRPGGPYNKQNITIGG